MINQEQIRIYAKEVAKAFAIDCALRTPQSFRPDFPEWLQQNAHIYVEFERRALQVAHHRHHYSARTIVEVMRHDSAIGQLTGEYKVNGNYVPDMATLFAQLNPQYGSLFEFRRDARNQERLAA